MITERGKPIGQIVPEEKSMEERMHQLVESGFISWNGKKLPSRELIVANRSNSDHI